MRSAKCPHCGLANYSTDVECRRCGKLLYRPTDRVVTDRPPRRNALISLLIFAALAVGGYYIYTGMRSAITHVGENETKRVAAQPKTPAQQNGLSRADDDRQRAQRVANAVNISPALAEHQKRVQETERMVNQTSNPSQQ
ncbi:MAG: hypothetical protein AB7V18_12580 [Pyrinomonadaceae bacterium]